MIKRLLSRIGARTPSLRWAMLYALTIGIVVAVVVFLLVRLGFTTYISQVYLSDENVEEREEDFVSDLQEYVTDRRLSSSDTAELAKWTRSNKYVYVMIYKDNALFFQTGDFEEDKGDGEQPGDAEGGTSGSGAGSSVSPPGITVERPTREDLIKYAEENDSHILTMRDAEVLVSMADFTEYFYYDITNIVAIIAAMLVLIVVIMIYYGGVTGRITRLAHDVSLTAEGDMTRTISAEGGDEIARLAGNVENMRASIVDNLEKEKAARAANEELITSMSHDIRTPLTVLLGYIDMMKSRNTDPEMAEYIAAGERTALRLKELSDGMFNYFLVFGGGVSDAPLLSCDAGILLEQMLSEFDLLLREGGYDVVRRTSDAAQRAFSVYNVLTDAPEAMRVVENLFSNISKYADKTAPVSIYTDFTDQRYKLTLTNRIAEDSGAAESNGVGLKTCRKLSERIFHSFATSVEGDSFVAEIVFITEPRSAT